MLYIKGLITSLFIIFSANVLAVEFDLVKANEFMRSVDTSLKQEKQDYNHLKEMYAELEKYNFQAEQCIQDETKKLSNIATLEQDTGLTQDVTDNTEDVQYILNKKKLHSGRLSQCRLYVFKSQDKMLDLQTQINTLDAAKELTPREKIWETLTHKQTFMTSMLILGAVTLASIICYLFLRKKISTLHLIRLTRMPELKILKYTLCVLIGGWIIFLLLEWLDLPLLTLQKTQNFLINGTSIYNINIVPLRWVVAILIFCLIQIIGKYTAMRFANQSKFNDESETNIVIGSLLRSAVVTIAIIGALLVAGVDFTGLAIVAGALSVGIGFGLQNIVNNFVSGLILLIEKPIRPGDRIMVKGVEGYVEEISIRSTRIVSFLKEDIIFPNSELISNPITNFVLHGTLSRMSCKVQVAYDSDIKFVMDTLIAIALQHSDVLKDSPNKPYVVLLELKESGMLFELACIVKHVDKKYGISSDINIMIVNTFKEKGITIAYPHLEVRMLNECDPNS